MGSDMKAKCATPRNMCGRALPLRRLDGRVGRRVDERAAAHIGAGLDAELAAPVARGREAVRMTLVHNSPGVGLEKYVALCPIANLPGLFPRRVHACVHAVAAVPVAGGDHALRGAEPPSSARRQAPGRARGGLE